MRYCASCGAEVAPGATSCAACGKLTGAARPAPAPLKPKSGLSGPGLAVAIAAGAFALLFVIGIIAALLIPNLLDALQKAKQKRTLADIRSASMALVAYMTDEGVAPRVTTMDELAAYLEPLYLAELPREDGWGNELRFACWGGEPSGGCEDFGIASAGRDGIFEYDDLRDYPEAPFGVLDYDRDIVFRSLSFVQFPEGR